MMKRTPGLDLHGTGASQANRSAGSPYLSDYTFFLLSQE